MNLREHYPIPACALGTGFSDSRGLERRSLQPITPQEHRARVEALHPSAERTRSMARSTMEPQFHHASESNRIAVYTG